jgi:hypothetical protein
VQRPGVSTSALWIALAAGLLTVAQVAHAAECGAPKVVVVTATAMKYCIDPAFDGLIQDQVRKIRQDIKARPSAGKLIVFVSTPISPRGGGYTPTNLDVAASVKAALEKEYGDLVMWTAVLAGDDGTAQDFDMVDFTGPSNMRAFFGCGASAVVECIDRYVTKRAATDETFRQDVADQPARRRDRRRPLGGQVAMYFDGRPLSPGEMETVVSPGYEFRP